MPYKILSVNTPKKPFELPHHDVKKIYEMEIKKIRDIESYDYIIVNGGDGTVRRTIERLHKKKLKTPPRLIINPAGTFNVLFKAVRCKNFKKILEKLENSEPLESVRYPYYTMNKKRVFVFSAGNSLDVIYITISELLRVGFLKKSKLRYLLSFITMLPLVLIMGPFFLINRHYCLVFSVIKPGIRKLLNLYFSLETLSIDLKSTHTIFQLDGDLVMIKDKTIHIQQAGEVEVVTQ